MNKTKVCSRGHKFQGNGPCPVCWPGHYKKKLQEETYIALLRGINVGGSNKVEMSKLKLMFEKLGFTSVKTYIASGNVVFHTIPTDYQELSKKIESAIYDDFGFQCRVLIHNFQSIERLVKAIPSSWINDKNAKCDVMFLWKEIDNEKVLKELPFNPAIEDVKYVPGAVLWRIDRKFASKSRMYKIVGTKLFQHMSVRNPNTVRKIYQIMSESKSN